MGCEYALHYSIVVIRTQSKDNSMRTPEQIRAYLQDANLAKVAKETGLHYNSMLAIKNDVNGNPTWRTIKIISEYIDAREQAARK